MKKNKFSAEKRMHLRKRLIKTMTTVGLATASAITIVAGGTD